MAEELSHADGSRPHDAALLSGYFEPTMVADLQDSLVRLGEPYMVVSLMPFFFGRLVTVAEVPDLVPLIYCDGGPQDGWVYDERNARREPAPVGSDSFTYEYSGEVVMLPDARLARRYAPAALAPQGEKETH